MAALRMRKAVDGIKPILTEEAAKRPSRRTHSADPSSCTRRLSMPFVELNPCDEAAMLFMVIENFRNQDAKTILSPLPRQGGA